MARLLADRLWLCVDCAVVAVNSDTSGLHPERAAAVCEGLADLCQRHGGLLVADWGDGTADGIDAFSWNRCACCLSALGGERHRFAIIA